jgi:hypothetical protein
MDSLLDTMKRKDMRLLHKIKETARSSDQDVATLLQLFPLFAHRTTAVDDAWAQHGTIAEATGLVEDLSR